MATRTLADIPPTATTIALNAYIFGYAGHSLVTPHTALKQLWWTEDRITAKVTREFVLSRLQGRECYLLDKPLAFGESLTDDTYIEWILNRARRLFLILSHIGVPDQIFGCIDDALDDDDLPVSLETARGMKLSVEKADSVGRRFYDAQFIYLLREMKQGTHLDYEPSEHIPMDYANTLPPAVVLQRWDRVHFPDRPDQVFVRRKFDLKDDGVRRNLRRSFRRDVRLAQSLQHDHIAPAWGSYSAKDSAYLLTDFVGEHTLGTFMAHRLPPQFSRLAKTRRPALLCEWMHCLADAVAYLHEQNIAHTSIRPSNIIINAQNHVAFSDVGSIRTLQRGKKVVPLEAYDYAAPESQTVRFPITGTLTPTRTTSSTYRQFYQRDSSTSGSASDASSNSTYLSSVWGLPFISPITSPMSSRRNSRVTTEIDASPESPIITAKGGKERLNCLVSTRSSSSAAPSLSPVSPTGFTSAAQSFPPLSRRNLKAVSLVDLPVPSPQQSDIFSLGCVFLDIITFIVEGRVSDFAKYRRTKVVPVQFPGDYRSRRTRIDASFHSNLDKISDWMSRLESEAWLRSDEHAVFRAVPALLHITRSMLAQNASLRPGAAQVRDALHAALTREVYVTDTLCCADRRWSYGGIPDCGDGDDDGDDDELDFAPTASRDSDVSTDLVMQGVRTAPFGATSLVHSSPLLTFRRSHPSSGSDRKSHDNPPRASMQHRHSVDSVVTANTVVARRVAKPRFSWIRWS